MPAILGSIAKWIVTAIILPLVNQWVSGYMKTRKKIERYKASRKDAQVKAEAYEKNPTDSNRNDLP